MRRGQKINKVKKREIVEKVCELYGANSYTIESCANEAGISWGTFWNWCNDNDEFDELYKKAQAKKDRVYKSQLKQLARTSLQKRIEGYDLDIEEVIEETMNDSEGNQIQLLKVRTKRTSRHIAPDTRAIIFALTNTDSQNFQRGQVVIDFSKLSEEEADGVLDRLAEKLKKETV